MTASDPCDDTLDALLRASRPEPLADDGFVGRTLAAVDVAARSLPARRRAAPVAPLAIARALVAEERRHAEQARLWRWAMAGVVVGFFLLVATVAVSPGRVSIDLPGPSQWLTLSLMMALGAVWVAWRELRDN